MDTRHGSHGAPHASTGDPIPPAPRPISLTSHERRWSYCCAKRCGGIISTAQRPPAVIHAAQRPPAVIHTAHTRYNINLALSVVLVRRRHTAASGDLSVRDLFLATVPCLAPCGTLKGSMRCTEHGNCSFAPMLWLPPSPMCLGHCSRDSACPLQEGCAGMSGTGAHQEPHMIISLKLQPAVSLSRLKLLLSEVSKSLPFTFCCAALQPGRSPLTSALQDQTPAFCQPLRIPRLNILGDSAEGDQWSCGGCQG